MSHTTPQPEPQPATTPDGPDPSELTGAPARLWAALTKLPGATAAELADAAGIGRSTAGKTLPDFETSGLARRHHGGFEGKRRLPDHWYPTIPAADTGHPATPDDEPATEPRPDAPATVPATDGIAEEPGNGADPQDRQDSADEATHTEHDENSPEIPEVPEPEPLPESEVEAEDCGTEDEPDPEVEPNPLPEAQPEPEPHPETEPEPEPVPVAGEGPGEAPTPAPEPDPTPVATPDTPPDAPAPAAVTTSSGKRQRLAPGSLRQMVLDHLRAHPSEAFTATAISRVIDKSSGAIANALVTLTQQQFAEQVHEHPRRYQAHATQQ